MYAACRNPKVIDLEPGIDFVEVKNPQPKKRVYTVRQVNRMMDRLLKFMLIFAVVALIIGLLIGWGLKSMTVSSFEFTGYELQTVHTGDTVWSLCAEIENCPYDIRRVVDRVMELNDIDDAYTLQPGATILLPTW